jgi:replicative DNA helicase
MSQSKDSRIPYSQEAEQALIGAALIDPEVISRIEIPLESFYIHRHRWIWEAMQELVRRSITPDFVTLTDELNTRGQLGEIGGPAYLTGLISETPSSLRADDYAALISDKARRRKMIETATELARAAYDSEGKLDDAVIRAIGALTNATRTKGAARPLAEYIQDLELDVAERVENPRDIFGLATSILDFDEITGGCQQGETLYIGGDPGIGKSILSMQMGMGMAAQAPGAIYSLEMKGMQVSRRIVSAMGKIEAQRLKTGRMSLLDMQAFTKACEAAKKLPVYMSDESYWTTAGIRADLARLKTQGKIGWFVLDYMLLLSDGDGGIEEIERSGMLSARIKRICKEFDLAGITVNSVTKDGKIRGSNQVNHDADTIIMLSEHQPDSGKPDPRMRTVVFVKGRELAKPKKLFHLLRAEGYPAFVNLVKRPLETEDPGPWWNR